MNEESKEKAKNPPKKTYYKVESTYTKKKQLKLKNK